MTDEPPRSAGRLTAIRVLGFGLIVLGLISLSNAVDPTLVTTISIGWLLVIGGALQLVGAFATGVGVGWRAAHVPIGILYVVAGLNVVVDPLSGAIALTILLGAVIVVDGLLRILEAFMDRRDGTTLILLLGAVDVLFGLWLWTGIPFSGVVIGVFAGIQLLVAGMAWLAAGRALRISLEQRRASGS